MSSQAFNLKSDYFPTGDQPQAIAKLEDSLKKASKHQTLLGVTGSGKTFTLANVIQRFNVPTLVISHNKTLAAQLYQEFRDFFPDNAVSYFVSYYDYYQPEAYIPSTDTYIEKETDINEEIDRLRLSATSNLLSRRDTIVVASVSCIYNLGSPALYAQHFLELVAGQVIQPSTIAKRLVDLQYERKTNELSRGSFRVLGESMQVWSASETNAYSIVFDTHTVKSIHAINPVSFEEIECGELDNNKIILYAAKHNVASEPNRQLAMEMIKNDLRHRLSELKTQGKVLEAYRLAQKVKYDLDMISELGYVNGIENYSRYFDGRKPGEPPHTLIDYFHHNASIMNDDRKIPFLTIIDESHITLPQLRGMFAGDRSRKQTLIDYGFRLPSALDNRPLKFEESLERLPHIVYASATPDEYEISLSKSNIAEQLIRPTGLVDPKISIRPSKGQVKDLLREIIKRVTSGQRVLVTTLTKATAEALTEYLNDVNEVRKIINPKKGETVILPKVAYLHADIQTLDRSDILAQLRTGEFDVLVGINLLREGLDLPEVSLVAILEADREGFLRSSTSLIQIMGRAARNVDGLVIMYADKVTGSMKRAIDEVERRRQIQINYNQDNKIDPRSIVKPQREKLLNRVIDERPIGLKPLKEFSHLEWQSLDDIKPQSLTPSDKKRLISSYKRLMKQAADAWEFEKAALYRDVVGKLKQD